MLIDSNTKVLMLPSGVGEGKLFSFLPKDGTGDFTVGRNSEKTRVNAQGLTETVPANVPTITYMNGNPKVSVEGESTNLYTFSESVGDASYVSQGLSLLSVNSDQGIDGELSATYIKEDSADSAHQIYKSLSVVDGEEYSTSCFFKPLNFLGRELLLFSTGANIVSSFSRFNFQQKTHMSDGNTISTNMIELPDGWFYCSMKVAIVGGTNIASGFRLSNGQGRFNYQGTGDKDALITKPQFEKGEATSYIPTNETIGTRLADNITLAPPAGTTQIIETIDGAENVITTIPPTYQLPVGNIDKIQMI